MKKREARIVQRVQLVLSSIPLPQDGGGTQSQSLSGFVSYAADMRHVTPIITAILRQSYMGEDEPGEVERELSELEAWVVRRKARDWGWENAGWKGKYD